MTVAERIMLIIENKNLTMTQFAKVLNVTPAYISKIKKYPETVPSDRILNDICRLFHVSDNWLRTGEGEMYAPKTRAVEIAEMTRQMYESNDTRYQLMKLVSQMTAEQIETVKNLALELAASINDTDN